MGSNFQVCGAATKYRQFVYDVTKAKLQKEGIFSSSIYLPETFY